MPDPNEFESEEDFMAACIPAVEAEGADHDQAVAQCLSVWSERGNPMSKHERTARIEGIDSDGFFSMTLVSEGEASDGDILSIAGGQMPDRMPLMLSHVNDPKEKMGSLGDFVKLLKNKPPQMDARGQIELGGTGVLADIRRDIAYMTNKHGTAISIRWDEVDGGQQPIRRVNLPSDHPYFVNADSEKSWRKRGGYFWPEWKGLEGSIVALGADPLANAHARAAETTGPVSAFWRSMAQDAEEQQNAAKAAASLAELRTGAAACLQAGASIADLLNAVSSADASLDPDGFQRFEIGGQAILLPSFVADQLQQKLEELASLRTAAACDPEPDQEPEPEETVDQRSPLELNASELPAPIDVQALVRLILNGFDESDQRTYRKIMELIDRATGRVS